MALTLDWLLDATHLVTFLAGTAVGAAGTYLADKATDKRRDAERVDARLVRFRQLKAHMLLLIAEMRKDISDPRLALIRDIAVLPTASTGFIPSKPTLVYHEDEHEDLIVKLDALAAAGFAVCVNETRPQRYRMGEDLAFLVLNDK
ncbi:hypothetical protein WKW80_05180 [Variovorax humicola]|uniref:Uncharacterized protein n=1 Tax=Variovorax humicola TaxID=1769758 RepID=A0ABU8VUU1_9BURK